MMKNRKSRSKIKIFTSTELFTFALSEFLCLALIAAGSYAFYKSFSQILSKNDEKPVAVVSSKIKTSRRCFEKRNLWDILKVNSLIYNGDIICTDENSQTTLLFDNGVELTLAESTMTQIIIGKDNQLKINLSAGNILVDSAAKKNPATIIYKNSTISMQGKALVSAAELNNKQLEVQVFDGKADVKSDSNEKIQVAVGEAVQLEPQKNIRVVKPQEAMPVTVLVKEENKLETKSKAVEKAAGAKIIAQAVEKPAAVVKKSSERENLSMQKLSKIQKNLTAAEKNTPQKPTVRKIPAQAKRNPELNVKALSSAVLLKPAQGKIFDDNYFLENQKIIFVWNKVENADSYIFTLKDSEGKILKQETLGNTTSYTLKELSILSSGKKTLWSVQALNSDRKLFSPGPESKAWFMVKLGEISGETSISGNLYGRKK